VRHGRIENRQAFVTVPTLEELRYLLIIIVEEITKYQVWPVRSPRWGLESFLNCSPGNTQANCWFFCSLVQQHLEGASDGWFENGSLMFPKLASSVRTRVSERLRLLYHAPVAISVLVSFCMRLRYCANTAFDIIYIVDFKPGILYGRYVLVRAPTETCINCAGE
jgi:hypothetical protein